MERDLYDFKAEPLLIVISGPAGVGKDSVLNRMKELEYPLHYVITATDRAPRPNERDGVDYYFISTEEFERMSEEGELLEHAVVYGQYKGVPKQQVRQALAEGKDVIMRVDVQGAATIRSMAPQAVLIFLAPSSEEELYHRLHHRDTESPDQLALRLEMAHKEMQLAQEFDYVVVNKHCELDQAVEQVACIIEAEHCRVPQRVVKL